MFQCTIYPDDSFLVLCKISVFSGHSPFLPSISAYSAYQHISLSYQPCWSAPGENRHFIWLLFQISSTDIQHVGVSLGSNKRDDQLQLALKLSRSESASTVDISGKNSVRQKRGSGSGGSRFLAPLVPSHSSPFPLAYYFSFCFSYPTQTLKWSKVVHGRVCTVSR